MSDELTYDQFDTDEATGLKFFTWRGQKRYKCPQNWEGGAHCSYDTYDLASLRKHLAEPHSFTGKQAGRTTQRVSQVLGPNGESIIVEKPVPDELTGIHFAEE